MKLHGNIQIKKENYDELIALLNLVFAKKNNRETNFEKDLPKMCVRDDEHMRKHFGIREDGKLVAALGVYPLPTTIAGEKLMFSTVGNVATHWDYCKRGYMSLLMKEAMKELERIGADASRLGGLRQRYNRFGYESCGTNYNLTIIPHNILRCYNDIPADSVIFSEIGCDDIETLDFCKALYDKGGIAVERSAANNYFDVYNSIVAWQNKPIIAKSDDGEKSDILQ